MEKTIIHVDMDAFYAAVEIMEHPDLARKPLIIGALPHERGVVSTCSYEARVFGVRSGMSIKEAYRRCPHGIYRHPNMQKNKAVSEKLHEIWCSYTNIVEYISLDEGYLDITGLVRTFEDAKKIGHDIKRRTKQETGLTCSIGIGYSMAAAKLASEEKKPDGLFEIPDPAFFVNLVIDRNVRVLHGVGVKTAEKLQQAGIYTVRDIRNNRQEVIRMLGKNGRQIADLAAGIDTRSVTPYYEAEAKSIGREHTFQHDITDFAYLKDVLILLARDLSITIRFSGLYCRTVTLKVTYWNMKSITRSKSGDSINQADDIYKAASALLDTVERDPVRLVGISLEHLSDTSLRQLTWDDVNNRQAENRKNKLEGRLLALQRKFGADIIKTGIELEAEKRLTGTDVPEKKEKMKP